MNNKQNTALNWDVYDKITTHKKSKEIPCDRDELMLMYNVLTHHRDYYGNDRGTTHIGYTALAAKTGYGNTRIKKIINGLQQLDIIQYKSGYSSTGEKVSNWYLFPLEEWNGEIKKLEDDKLVVIKTKEEPGKKSKEKKKTKEESPEDNESKGIITLRKK